MILAIDPGLATYGWAIVTPVTGRVVALGAKSSPADPRRGKNEDRLTRAADQAAAFVELVRTWGCTAIAAEAISLPRKGGINAYASIFLSWGVIRALAVALAIPLTSVRPQKWQRAVVPDVVGGDYAAIERALTDYMDALSPGLLAAIPARYRNHALDAVGVGVYTALRGDAAAERRPRRAA